jgi:hypothetical protein
VQALDGKLMRCPRCHPAAIEAEAHGRARTH